MTPILSAYLWGAAITWVVLVALMIVGDVRTEDKRARAFTDPQLLSGLLIITAAAAIWPAFLVYVVVWWLFSRSSGRKG